MSKGIIIYQSKYGSTKKYVQWLQEATGFDAIEVKKAKADMMNDYHTGRSMRVQFMPLELREYPISERIKNALAGKKNGGILCGSFTV